MANTTTNWDAKSPSQKKAIIKSTLETIVKYETTALANPISNAAKSNYQKDLVALCEQDETFRMETVRILEEMLHDLRHKQPNERLSRVAWEEHRWLQKHTGPLERNPECVLNLEHWTTPKCSCDGFEKPLFMAEECKPLGPQDRALQSVFLDITLGKRTPKGP